MSNEYFVVFEYKNGKRNFLPFLDIGDFKKYFEEHNGKGDKFQYGGIVTIVKKDVTKDEAWSEFFK